MDTLLLVRLKHIHFIGIGGISMSGLALYLKERGYTVSGSDVSENEQVCRLENYGVKIYIGHREENVEGAELVVFNSAISPDNCELLAAARKAVPLVSRVELLAEIMRGFPYSIGVAGSHGKTTATAMCMHALFNSCENVTAHIGGEDARFGNFYSGGDKFFVTEACEFKKNFLKLEPSVAILLNCDKDHLDCYEDEEELNAAFVNFATRAKTRIVNADDAVAARVSDAITFALNDRTADFVAEDLRSHAGKYAFTVSERGEKGVRIRLNVYGKHNVYNALAAFAVGRYYRFEPRLLAQGLEQFTGILRRFERLGKFAGAEFIADYAHHPREITAVLASAREVCAGRLFVVFQPHTYSRTKLLFDDFLKVLCDVENLVVYKTYAAREYFDSAGSAYTLAQNLPNALYAESIKELQFYLKPVLSPGDMVLFLGAGDIYCAAKLLLKQLTE